MPIMTADSEVTGLQDWRLDRSAHVAISAASAPSPRAGRTPPQAAGPSPAQPQVLPTSPGSGYTADYGRTPHALLMYGMIRLLS